jgi:polyisoprenoid-binding protein YceI
MTSTVPTTAPRATVTNTGVWDLDVAHSVAEFSIRHMMIATVKGSFRVKSGVVRYDERDPAATAIEAVLDAASVNTGADQRDGHLRSADFFDAANHPELTFRSARVTPKGDETYRVEGDLVIRGVAKPVVLDVEVEGTATDPWGNRRAGVVATTSFDRSAWGLTWNQAIEAGGVLVGDRVKVTLHLQLVQRKQE